MSEYTDPTFESFKVIADDAVHATAWSTPTNYMSASLARALDNTEWHEHLRAQGSPKVLTSSVDAFEAQRQSKISRIGQHVSTAVETSLRVTAKTIELWARPMEKLSTKGQVLYVLGSVAVAECGYDWILHQL